MREIPASEVEIHLPRLLGGVACGETIFITRHGRPIARLVPLDVEMRENAARALGDLEELRNSMLPLSFDDTLSARHEGHKY
jgi:prevent-host-death family protein